MAWVWVSARPERTVTKITKDSPRGGTLRASGGGVRIIESIVRFWLNFSNIRQLSKTDRLCRSIHFVRFEQL